MDSLPVPHDGATHRPLSPDRIAIWPVEGGLFGIDISYRGKDGYSRAHELQGQLSQMTIKSQFRQEVDQAWTVRMGPVEREAMLIALNSVVLPHPVD